MLAYYYIPLLALLSVPVPILLHMFTPLLLLLMRWELQRETTENESCMVIDIFLKIMNEVLLLALTFMVSCPLLLLLIILRMVWIYYVVWHYSTNYVLQAVIFLGIGYEWVWFVTGIPDIIAWITGDKNSGK